MLISVALGGGLGNQLFQYAYGKELEFQGHDIYFDTRELSPSGGIAAYGLDGFKLEPRLGCPQGAERRVGYWQSEQFFPHVTEHLRQSLVPWTISHDISHIGNHMESTNSIALHVRRQDYLHFAAMGCAEIVSVEWYRAAVAYIAAQYPDPQVYVFSDDLPWCQNNIPGQLMTGNTRHVDMWLISRCRHAITANSTFSWWGAWLGDTRSDRIVVTPKKWFSNPEGAADAKMIQPERWVKQ